MKDFKEYEVVEAKGLVLKGLNFFGFAGWTSNWGKIYIRPDQINNVRLINHEQVHAMQIQRDGVLWQPIKYGFYLLKYGYRNNPYEVEARKLSGESE